MSSKVLLREAIDRAICYRMIVRRYGSLQWQVAFREDKTDEHSSLCDTLEEAYDLIPILRLNREEEEGKRSRM